MDNVSSHQLTREAVQNLNLGLVLLDSEGHLVQMNTWAEALCGYMCSEIRGISFWKLIREGKKVPGAGVSYFLNPKSGESIPVNLRFSPLLEDSDIQLVFIQDLRESNAREQDLHVQQTKLNALLEAIPDHIFIQDFEGRFLDYYPAVEEPMFPSETRVVGRHMSDLFPMPLCQQYMEAFAQIRTDRNTRLIEFRTEVPREAYYEARLVPMNNHKILSIIREVTESKMLQNIVNLRNRALEAAGNGIVISDARQPDFPILYANRAFLEITGYTYSEIVGRNCRFLQGQDREQSALEEVRYALAKGTSTQVVLRNFRKDGSLFWNELTITPILDEDGTATHFIGVIKDVTETVRENQRKDQIRSLLQDIGEDQPLEDIARGMCQLLVNQVGAKGVLLSRLEKNHLKALSHAGLSEAVASAFAVLDMESDTTCPCQVTAKTGEEHIIPDLQADDGWREQSSLIQSHGIRSCWSLPIFSSQKEILGTCTLLLGTTGSPDSEMTGMIREVIHLTGVAIERDRNREQLEESKSQLESYARILEQNVEARTQEVHDTFEKLLESNTHLKDQIQTAREAENRATVNQKLFAAIARDFPRGIIMVLDQDLGFLHLEGEEMDTLGLAEWDYLNQKAHDLPGLSAPHRDLLVSKVRKTLQGAHLSFELEHSGQAYAVNSSPLSLQEKQHWALLVFSNTTEQKRTEQELVRALRIEQELNDLKSRFISMASHEFRTPLSAILSSAILIGKQNDPEAGPKRDRYVRQIKNNVRNLVVILDDFLSLGKLEEGDIGCQPSRFDLLSLLRSVIDELEPSLKVGQHFVEDCHAGQVELYQDPKFVRHILVNLLSNAIKYSPENSLIHITIVGAGDTLELRFQDQGMGIPQAEQPQIFNRFFRAKNAINIPGTGLGLHIVKQYTELMGGNIRFESKAGMGSTFIVRLPYHFNP